MDNNKGVQVKKLADLIEEYTFIINNGVIGYIHEVNSHISEPKKFHYTLLFKINNSLNSANVLFHNILNNRQFSDSIFLILRTCLGDILTLQYILFMSKKDDNRYLEYINACYGDHVKYTIKSSNYKDVLGVTNKEWDEAVKKIKSTYPHFFDLNGQLLKTINDFPGISTMPKKMFSQTKKDERFKHVADAYHYYDIYSKLEHFGVLTEYLVHRSFNEPGISNILLSYQETSAIISYYLFGLIKGFIAIDSQGFPKIEELFLKIYNFRFQ